MALTKTNLRMMDTGFITPLDFGAAGDGATDDGPELQLALNASDYSVIDLAGKTYATNQQLTLTRSNVTIRNGTIKYTGTSKSQFSILKIYGTDTSTTVLDVAASVSIGEYVVRVDDSSTIAVGDWVKIAHNTDATDYVSFFSNSSENMDYPNFKTVFFSDMQKITANDASTEDLTTLNPILGKLTTSSKVTELTSVLENINIINVTFQGHALRSIAIDNNGFSNASDQVVTVSSATHGLVVNDYVYFGNGNSDGDGFHFEDHVRGERTVSEIVDTTTFKYTNSGTTTTGTDGDANAVGLTGLNRALEINYCSDITISNCYFKDCPGGIVELNYVNNCNIDSNVYEGPAYPEADIFLLGNTTPYLTITNNRIHGGRGGNGVFCPSGHTARRGTTYNHTGGAYCLIKDNHFIGIRGCGIQLSSTFVRARIEGNHFSHAPRFLLENVSDTTSGNFNSLSIYLHTFDTEILNNHMENVMYTGILIGNTLTQNDVLTGDNSTSSLYSDTNNFIPFRSFKIHGNRVYSSRQRPGTQGISILGRVNSALKTMGSQITNNLVFGFKTGWEIATLSDTTDHNLMFTNNVTVSLPSTSTTNTYGFYSTGPGSIKRWLFNNNIFDVQGTAAAVDGAHNIYLWDTGCTNSTFNGNILSFENTAGSSFKNMNFGDVSLTGTVTLQVQKSIFVGNVFSGCADATKDLGTSISADNQPYNIGPSLSTTAADYAERYGLNVWSNINASGWPGPD